jgi:hypothetical protein
MLAEGLARQTGSFSIACATTDTAAAIAAHAAQGACLRMSGKPLGLITKGLADILKRTF